MVYFEEPGISFLDPTYPIIQKHPAATYNQTWATPSLIDYPIIKKSKNHRKPFQKPHIS